MNDWKKSIININSSIMDAIKKIDDSGQQIALIVDDTMHLQGIITDGDVRRAIINGVDLNKNVSEIMTTTPVFLYEGYSRREAQKLIKNRYIHHIPILSKDRVLVGLTSFAEVINAPVEKENEIVIMAGGLGSRLKEYTQNCPKPLLSIGDKPILETIINNFKEYGFYNFSISVNYKSNMIEDYFEDGSKFGVRINYLHENKRLGTAGALSLLSEEKLNNPVIVINGDILTKIDFDSMLKYHNEESSVATMATRKVVNTIPYGVINIDGNIINEVIEKPRKEYMVNAGIYILEQKVIRRIPQDTYYDMTTVFQKLINDEEKAIAFPIHEYWIDIGQIEDFKKAQEDYNNVFVD